MSNENLVIIASSYSSSSFCGLTTSAQLAYRLSAYTEKVLREVIQLQLHSHSYHSSVHHSKLLKHSNLTASLSPKLLYFSQFSYLGNL